MTFLMWLDVLWRTLLSHEVNSNFIENELDMVFKASFLRVRAMVGMI